MFLALKEIKHSKFRYALITIMIIMISYLVFILMGMMLGLANENKAAINSWGTQTVFLNKNANGSLSAAMITKDQLPTNGLSDHEALVGQVPVVITRAGKHQQLKENAQVIGLDRQQFIAKHKIKLTAGHQAKGAHQIVVDEGLRTKGYHIGDQVRLNSSQQKYEIVGFAKNAKLNVAPVIYTTLANWQQLKGVNDQVVASGIVADRVEPLFRNRLYSKATRLYGPEQYLYIHDCISDGDLTGDHRRLPVYLDNAEDE